MGLWGVGLASVLGGCDSRHARPTPAPPSASVASGTGPTLRQPPPHYGPTEVVFGLPAGSRDVALTIDDGYDPETVAAYVQFAATTRIPLTFNPNGRYAYAWAPHAPALRPLIEAGQVQIGNHTFDHTNLLLASDSQVRAEIERNEDWIHHTFGTTSRPWMRPPFGYRDARTDELARSVGFTKILMWDGTFGDSRLLTPRTLLTEASRYLTAGTIVLGHANHPTVTHLFGAITELINERGLTPATLDHAFGLERRPSRDLPPATPTASPRRWPRPAA
jgi:peptidoglycan/xylan/chitin deacetylase (PgdA/CDA1 family)